MCKDLFLKMRVIIIHYKHSFKCNRDELTHCSKGVSVSVIGEVMGKLIFILDSLFLAFLAVGERQISFINSDIFLTCM